jgi:hypothetical protein
MLTWPRVAVIGILALAASTSCDPLFKEHAERMGLTVWRTSREGIARGSGVIDRGG